MSEAPAAPASTPAADMSRMFTPKAIALIGVSSNPLVSGGQPLRFLKEYGYEGGIYPVNPKRPEVQDVKSYASVLDVPETCDLAVIMVAAPLVAGAIRDCGKAGIPYAVVMSAGFEQGENAESPLQQALKDAIAESGVRVVGPNCTGIVNLHTHAFCAQGGALSDKTLRAGEVAVVAQSGGVGLSMLAFLHQAGCGVGYLASSGNEVDLDVFDLAAQLITQPDVSIVTLYLETSTRGHKLRALGQQALALGKPVVVLKAGNSGRASEAASSHTGKLTADYKLFRAAFDEGGYVEVGDIDELVETVSVLKSGVRAHGKRVVIQTTSGGWGVMLAERCEALGLELPPLAADTLAAIKPLVPPFASLANPLDITPAGYKDQYASYNEITRLLLSDPVCDVLVVRSATGGDMAVWADGLLRVVADFDKPIFVHWATSPGRFEDVRQRLLQAGIPCFSFVNQIARNVAAMVNFARKATRSSDAVAPAKRAALNLPTGARHLSEFEAIACLRAYGIPVAQAQRVRTEELAAADFSALRFPVAVKIDSADIPHKTDVGGVELGMKDAASLRATAAAVIERVKKNAPKARVDGVLVQEMASGLEMIVGAINDPHFGPFVMLGMGGVLTEVIDDVAIRFAPVTREAALGMIGQLRGRRALDAVRGRPARDVDALADAVVRLSRLIADWHDRIGEIEINPLFVHAQGEGVTAADCLIRVIDQTTALA
jgi:acyl-CoA synthetase (NDP forming)